MIASMDSVGFCSMMLVVLTVGSTNMVDSMMTSMVFDGDVLMMSSMVLTDGIVQTMMVSLESDGVVVTMVW